MKKTKMIIGICIIVVILLCCRKANYNAYGSIGIIMGPDIRMCACCGGWFIQIDSTTYEFSSLPDNSDINLEKETFPLYVKLDWKASNLTGCPDPKIVIQRIKKE